MNRKHLKTNLLNYLEPMISVVFWLLMLASPLLFGQFDDEIDWTHIFRIWRSFLPFLGLYLLNRFIFLPFFFFRGRRWLYFASNAILILATATMVHIIRPDVWLPEKRDVPVESLSPRGRSARGERLPGSRPPGHPPHGERAPGDLPPGERLSGELPSGERPPGELPPGERLSGELPPGERLSGELPPGERPPGELPPGSTPPGPGKGPLGRDPMRTLPPFLSFVAISVLIIGFDTGLMISVKWAQSEQHRARAEKENMASQLAFLQNQVSPHFFMNTLNNIHSLIDIDSEEAKEAIIKLSKLMRHMLYDSQVERIPLKKEIEFILNYVELMKLRFSDKVKVSLNIPGNIPEKRVPPLLFTSFVENAFKHGISYQEDSFVDISFSNGSDQLSFVVRNSNPKVKKEEGPSGIGLENSRKRLDLIFGDDYSLVIEESPEKFTIRLKIPV